MQFFPDLSLGLWNGWVLLAIFYSVFGFLLLVFPRDVVRRLYDRSDWSEQQKILSAMGKIFIFLWLLLAVFTPLDFGSWNFVFGMLLFSISLLGMVKALLDYRDTPMDEPVTRGMYSHSRNPQQVTIFVAFFGISFAIGSWAAAFTLMVAAVAAHVRVVAEENACLVQYGEDYRAYMKRVPRYLLFF